MKKIFKYPLLKQNHSQEIEVPQQTRLLHVNVQKGEWVLWAVVDLETKPSKRKIRVFGTGQELPPDLGIGLNPYINTFFEGDYVWHAFEVTE